jgi:hypothetical protein
MKFFLKQGEERVETMKNRGIKIKEVLRSIIVSFIIHYNTRFMIIPINQRHRKCFETKSAM